MQQGTVGRDYVLAEVIVFDSPGGRLREMKVSQSAGDLGLWSHEAFEYLVATVLFHLVVLDAGVSYDTLSVCEWCVSQSCTGSFAGPCPTKGRLRRQVGRDLCRRYWHRGTSEWESPEGAVGRFVEEPLGRLFPWNDMMPRSAKRLWVVIEKV